MVSQIAFRLSRWELPHDGLTIDHVSTGHELRSSCSSLHYRWGDMGVFTKVHTPAPIGESRTWRHRSAGDRMVGFLLQSAKPGLSHLVAIAEDRDAIAACPFDSFRATPED